MVGDALRGALKPFYRATRLPDLHNLPRPRRDLLKRDGYSIFNTVQTTRGCPFDCEFCSVTTMFSRSYRRRPVAEVVDEIADLVRGKRGLRDRAFFLVDDNVVAVPSYSKQLFRALIPLKIRWVSQGTITTFTQDRELLDLARRSGCLSLFIGFESISADNLKSVNKTFNKRSEYAENIARIHSHGIGIIGSFIYGLDHDTEETFRQTVAWAQENAIDAVNFSVLTPYPGTRLAARLQTEGRLLSTDWRDYHALANRVVFTHPRLSEEALLRGTAESWIRYYSAPSLLARLVRSPRSFVRNLPVILAYRRRAVTLRRSGGARAPKPVLAAARQTVRIENAG